MNREEIQIYNYLKKAGFDIQEVKITPAKRIVNIIYEPRSKQEVYD